MITVAWITAGGQLSRSLILLHVLEVTAGHVTHSVPLDPVLRDLFL